MLSPDDGDSPVQALQRPRDADAPFNDESADIVLRSSDDVDFHVHKLLLSIASPFFRDMFSLPQRSQANEQARPLPIVDLTEDAHTISLVLQCCYPIPYPDLTELKDVRSVLDAGRKYDMSAVMHHGKISLDRCVEKDALRVFTVACRHEFADICIKAAKRSLHHALDTLDAQEFANISAAQVHAFIQYHHRCCMATSSLVYSRACLSEGVGGMPVKNLLRSRSSCNRCTNDLEEPWRGPPELWRYLRRVENALKTIPHRSAASSDENLAVWGPSSLSCNCRTNYSHHSFAEALANQIDAVVAKVEVPDFC